MRTTFALAAVAATATAFLDQPLSDLEELLNRYYDLDKMLFVHKIESSGIHFDESFTEQYPVGVDEEQIMYNYEEVVRNSWTELSLTLTEVVATSYLNHEGEVNFMPIIGGSTFSPTAETETVPEIVADWAVPATAPIAEPVTPVTPVAPVEPVEPEINVNDMGVKDFNQAVFGSVTHTSTLVADSVVPFQRIWNKHNQFEKLGSTEMWCPYVGHEGSMGVNGEMIRTEVVDNNSPFKGLWVTEFDGGNSTPYAQVGPIPRSTKRVDVYGYFRVRESANMNVDVYITMLDEFAYTNYKNDKGDKWRALNEAPDAASMQFYNRWNPPLNPFHEAERFTIAQFTIDWDDVSGTGPAILEVMMSNVGYGNDGWQWQGIGVVEHQ